MRNLNDELQQKRREFSKWFTFSVLGMFLFYILLVFFVKDVAKQPFALPINVLIFGFLVAAYLGFLISKTKYNFVSIYRIILCSILFLTTYVSLLLCNISKTIYLLYIPIVLMGMLLTSFKKSVYFALMVLVGCYCISYVSNFFHLALSKDLYKNNPDSLHYQEYIVVAIVIYFAFFILHYFLEFNKIKIRYENNAQVVKSENQVMDEQHDNVDYKDSQNFQDPNVEVDKQDQKLDILYQKIIDFFEYKKPYQSPDFSIKKFAEDLETNTTYVSRALNLHGKKNFSTLVNEYRIAQVKEELAENIHHKFTLEYIYSRAGFTKQPTFNRVFKEQTGVTPSEYIENLQHSLS